MDRKNLKAAEKVVKKLKKKLGDDALSSKQERALPGRLVGQNILSMDDLQAQPSEMLAALGFSAAVQAKIQALSGARKKEPAVRDFAAYSAGTAAPDEDSSKDPDESKGDFDPDSAAPPSDELPEGFDMDAVDSSDEEEEYKAPPGGRDSTRHRRGAPPAGRAFSEYAGKNKIVGAEVDKHGNAAGTKYDLVADGMFKELSPLIVVFDLYGGSFTSTVQKALEDKGFTVQLHRRSMPAADKLHDMLEEANQMWLISGSSKCCSKDHLHIIRQHWLDGMACYVFGDNVPYYVDANRLMNLLLPDAGVQLYGNSPGQRKVELASRPGAPGFASHQTTTGIVSLYEGHTVSYVDPAKAKAAGFQEVLRDHDGKLVLVYRPAEVRGCGGIILDGAFTKLYCNWHAAGSARFVRNCACILAVTTGDDDDAYDEES